MKLMKKFLSLLLAVLMVAALVPASAGAAEPHTHNWVDDKCTVCNLTAIKMINYYDFLSREPTNNELANGTIGQFSGLIAALHKDCLLKMTTFGDAAFFLNGFDLTNAKQGTATVTVKASANPNYTFTSYFNEDGYPLWTDWEGSIQTQAFFADPACRSTLHRLRFSASISSSSNPPIYLPFYGVTLADNDTTSSGGAINVARGGIVELVKSNITRCKVSSDARGAAAIITAPKNAPNPGELRLTDSTVTGNTGHEAVYLQNGKLTLSGNTRICDNFNAAGEPANLCIEAGQKLTVVSPGEQMHIGVSVSGGTFPYVLAENCQKGWEKYFFADQPGLAVVYRDGKLVLQPTFAGAYLTIENNIAVNFVVRKDTVPEGFTPCVTYTVGGGKEMIASADASDETYDVFRLDALNPAELDAEISATLKCTNGEQEFCSDPKTYSIAQYCYNKLAGQTEKCEFSTLLVDLLNYGAAAQQYTGWKGTQCNAGLSPLQQRFATDGTPKMEEKRAVTGTGAALWQGEALVLEAGVTIRCYLAKPENASYVAVDCDDDLANGNTIETISAFGSDQNGTYFDFSGLPVANLRDVPRFTVCDASGKAISQTLCYSPETYAAQVRSGEKEAPLVVAMMKYADAADAYYRIKHPNS